MNLTRIFESDLKLKTEKVEDESLNKSIYRNWTERVKKSFTGDRFQFPGK